MKTFQKVGFRTFDLSLTSIMAAGNFAVSLYVAPALTFVIPKVFVGALLMTPLNLFLVYVVWAVTRRRNFGLYFFIYGLLAMPTTIWGNTPGIFKPLLGIAIGLSLDLVASKLQPHTKTAEFTMAIVFPVVWWGLTGAVWMLAGLPIVQMFQTMLMGVPALKPIASQGFVATFATIALMTMPSSAVATWGAFSLSKRVGQIVMIPSDRMVKEEVYHG